MLETAAGPLTKFYKTHAVSKTAFVDVVVTYANNVSGEKSTEEIQSLLEKMKRSKEGKRTHRPSTTRKRLNQLLSPSQVKQLVTDYQHGTDTTKLAIEYHIAKASVLKLLRTNQVVLRRQPLTSQQVEQAAKLYEQGYSLAQVAQRTSLPQETIRRALQSKGTQMCSMQMQKG